MDTLKEPTEYQKISITISLKDKADVVAFVGNMLTYYPGNLVSITITQPEKFVGYSVNIVTLE